MKMIEIQNRKIKLSHFLLIISCIFIVFILFFRNNLNLVLILTAGLFSIIFYIFLIKKEWAIYAIILFLFLEAYVFSFYFASARIRVVQIIEVIAIFSLSVRVLMKKSKLRKTPIDLPLWGYIFVNFIAIVNAPSFERSLKIFILLVSLVLLYYIIVNFIDNKELFDKAFNLLLYVGLAEIIYGLYQVFAGMSNYYLGTTLFVGHLGLIHSDFIRSPWGRPYGTFVAPDWYGAISMFFALLFFSLYFSRLTIRRRFYIFGMVISILGMFFSFVRASWFGFLVGIIILLIFKSRVKLSRLSIVNITKFLIFLFVIFLILIILSPTLVNVLGARITLSGSAGLGTTNSRFAQMRHSLKLFLIHPILGNGPGCFSTLGIWGWAEEYYNQAVEEGLLSLEDRYDPSIITTALADTGIVGMIFFILIIFSFFRYNFLTIPKVGEYYQVVSSSFLAGISGLFFSYIFTQGFWIPFTWVFLGLNISVLKLGLINKNKE
jgi:hypothetical protein